MDERALSKGLLLDTHVWFHLQVTPERLRSKTVDAIEAAALHGGVFISIFSVWELALLEHRGRLDLGGNTERWCSRALDRPGISMLPLTPEIAIDSVRLPEPMHKDPADRILVSTARVEQLTFVTADEPVLHFANFISLPCIRA